jgi:hypothetical protein
MFPLKAIKIHKILSHRKNNGKFSQNIKMLYKVTAKIIQNRFGGSFKNWSKGR